MKLRFTSAQENLALMLFDRGAVKGKAQSPEGKGFRLKLHETKPDAPLSPFYLNLRTPENPKPGPLMFEVVELIGGQLFDLAETKGMQYDCVAGLPNAGDPFAAAFVYAARARGKNVRLLKLTKVGTADKRQITDIAEGECRAGDQVLLVDDLVTEAGTKLEGIAAIEKHELVVAGIVVLVDREQGGAQQITERGYDFASLFPVSALLQLYVDRGRMPQADFDEIKAYWAAQA